MSIRRTSPRSKKPNLADHAAKHLLGSVGLSVLAVFIVGTLALSVTLANPAFNSSQLAAVVSARLVDLTNKDRASDTLGTLTVSSELTQAAQAKADDMAAKGYFAHTSPEGLDSWHWFKLVGYSFSYAGENLAVDFTDSDDVNQAWLNSPTHRANIMNGHYTQIGIATAEGTFEGHPTTFVVQMFGTPSKPAPITATVMPMDPKELATAQTEATGSAADDEQVLGISAAPVKAKPQASPSKVAVADTVAAAPAPTSTDAPAAPSASDRAAAPVEHAPAQQASFFARLLASPRSLLRGAYVLFGFILLIALAIRTRFELRQHHMKHVIAVLALLVLMGGLFWAADHFVFVAPIVGTGQSA